MADKPIQLVSGILTQVEAKIASAGAADSGRVVALDTAGKIDSSMMPVGVVADVKLIVASEAIGAGKYVNIFNNAGTANIRLADNSNGRIAHGYLLTAVAIAGTGTVYFEGPNTGLTALTAGSRQFLATAGGVTATAPVFPAATISQLVGVAISATEINTDIDDAIALA